MIGLYFECENCKNKIKKIEKFFDIFNIKKGQLISCSGCNSQYAINGYIAKFFKIYYTFIWGIAPINFLVIIYVLGVYLNIKGLFTLLVTSVSIYYLIELTIAIFLPVHKLHCNE